MNVYILAAVITALAGAMCAGVFYGGYRVGVLAGIDRADAEAYRRDWDPDDTVGRLPSEDGGEQADEEPTGSHSSGESFAALRDRLAGGVVCPPGCPLPVEDTQELVPVGVRPDCPSDMDTDERVSISRDRFFADTEDAADGGDQ